MLQLRLPHLLAASVVAGAIAAVACGGPPPNAPASTTGGGTEGAAATPQPGGGGGDHGAEGQDAGAAAAPSQTPTAEQAVSLMHPPVATNLAADLQAIGLDPAKLPPLSKLEGTKLRKVMKLFKTSLGAQCSDCHTEDYSAPTPKKNVAEKMWDEWARNMALANGQPIFCDSCHQGHLEFLDRRDKKALGKWMAENYVKGLHRRDNAEIECSTCHGDPFNPDFLEEWSKRPAKGPRHASLP